MSELFDLKARLEEMGLSPKKAFGQNFLVSPIVIGKIVDAVRARAFSDLVEIGPGLGALTEKLLELQPRLIELDRDLVEYWRKRGAHVLDHDALKLDWGTLGLRDDSLLVSNLPYQISSSLVIERCLGPRTVKFMVLMFQKEVAERLMARPGTKDYGLLSVMAQVHFDMVRVADAAPRDFYPAPKVASRVLGFTRKTEAVEPGARFLTVLKAGFAFRRKFLLKNLKSVVDKPSLARLPAVFEELCLKPQARAEELSPSQWVALFRKLHERN